MSDALQRIHSEKRRLQDTITGIQVSPLSRAPFVPSSAASLQNDLAHGELDPSNPLFMRQSLASLSGWDSDNELDFVPTRRDAESSDSGRSSLTQHSHAAPLQSTVQLPRARMPAMLDSASARLGADVSQEVLVKGPLCSASDDIRDHESGLDASSLFELSEVSNVPGERDEGWYEKIAGVSSDEGHCDTTNPSLGSTCALSDLQQRFESAFSHNWVSELEALTSMMVGPPVPADSSFDPQPHATTCPFAQAHRADSDDATLARDPTRGMRCVVTLGTLAADAPTAQMRSMAAALPFAVAPEVTGPPMEAAAPPASMSGNVTFPLSNASLEASEPSTPIQSSEPHVSATSAADVSSSSALTRVRLPMRLLKPVDPRNRVNREAPRALPAADGPCKASSMPNPSLAATAANPPTHSDDLQKKMEHVLARANELSSARATDAALHAEIDDVISFAATVALPPPNVPLSLTGSSRANADGSQGRSDAVRAYLADVFGAMYGPTYTPLSAVAPAAPPPATTEHNSQPSRSTSPSASRRRPSAHAENDTTVVMRTANADSVSIVDRRPKARGAVDELRMPPQPQPQAYPARVKDAIGITTQPDEVLAHGKVRDSVVCACQWSPRQSRHRCIASAASRSACRTRRDRTQRVRSLPQAWQHIARLHNRETSTSLHPVRAEGSRSDHIAQTGLWL
jgi:hypothetical protein